MLVEPKKQNGKSSQGKGTVKKSVSRAQEPGSPWRAGIMAGLPSNSWCQGKTQPLLEIPLKAERE